MPTIWNNIDKPSTITGGWSFNELAYTFNQSFDVSVGANVYFNGIGTSQIWTNILKP